MADFNVQLKEWLTTRANRRLHAAIRCRPIDRIAEDRAAMGSLPPVLPDVAWHSSLRLGRDHYVRDATCDYHQTLTDPAHGRARRELREAERAQPAPGDIEVEERDLATYDEALGVAS